MNLILKYVLYSLPHHLITFLVGSFMKSSISKYAIKTYAKVYQIDLCMIEKPIDEYENLNEFFKRKLNMNARPIEMQTDAFVSPVDGIITETGLIKDGALLQAKGVSYSVEQLLNDKEKAEAFQNGSYICIYLSPKDYHRVHAPMDGEITDYSYIPGRLFPVNKAGVGSIDGIYTKNERIATYMQTRSGHLALVKVGALIVGSVRLAYQRHVEMLHKGNPRKADLNPRPYIDKGEEIGHFEFGSTVILLFEEDQISFIPELQTGYCLKMGETLGYVMKSLERKIN